MRVRAILCHHVKEMMGTSVQNGTNGEGEKKVKRKKEKGSKGLVMVRQGKGRKAQETEEEAA